MSEKKKNPFQSMLVKVSMMLGFFMVLLSFICIFITVYEFDILVSKNSENYIYDVTLAYGNQLNNLYREKEEVTTQEIGSILEKVKLEDVESAYGYLVDEKGIMVYHPTSEKIGEPVENQVIKDVIAKLS